MSPMIKNPGRRSFIKKSLSLLSALTLSGCGGGSGSSSAVGTTTVPPSTTVTTATLPPSIVSHPLDRSVFTGESATFQVVAEGSQPLSYQWQRNGVNIPGAASSSYKTPSLATGDDAGFSVTVTNDAGTVASREAQLTLTVLVVTVDSMTITVDSTQLTVDNT